MDLQHSGSNDFIPTKSMDHSIKYLLFNEQGDIGYVNQYWIASFKGKETPIDSVVYKCVELRLPLSKDEIVDSQLGYLDTHTHEFYPLPYLMIGRVKITKFDVGYNLFENYRGIIGSHLDRFYRYYIYTEIYDAKFKRGNLLTYSHKFVYNAPYSTNGNRTIKTFDNGSPIRLVNELINSGIEFDKFDFDYIEGRKGPGLSVEAFYDYVESLRFSETIETEPYLRDSGYYHRITQEIEMENLFDRYIVKLIIEILGKPQKVDSEQGHYLFTKTEIEKQPYKNKNELIKLLRIYVINNYKASDAQFFYMSK